MNRTDLWESLLWAWQWGMPGWEGHVGKEGSWGPGASWEEGWPWMRVFSYLGSEVALVVSILELFLQGQAAWMLFNQRLFSSQRCVFPVGFSEVPPLGPDGLKGCVSWGLSPLSPVLTIPTCADFLILAL